jgi:hypothetical protein
LEQWAISVFPRSFNLLFNGCFQVNNQCIPLELRVIFFSHHRTATGGQNRMGLVGELAEHGGFTLPEAVLAFDVEDPGNIGAAPLFDDPVRIHESIAQLLGQHPANGAFASPHRANQDNSFGQGHNFCSRMFRRVRISQGRSFHKFRQINGKKKPPWKRRFFWRVAGY